MSGLEGGFATMPSEARLFKRPEGDVQNMSGLEGRFATMPSDAQMYQRPRGDVQTMSVLEGGFATMPSDARLYQRPEGDVQRMSGSRVGYTPEHKTGSRTMWIIGILIAVVLVLMSLVAGFMMMK